ncbi:MAG TPA: thiamine diphosphokinase [Spirochaetales bacterium]|nr:thiamine diphosphokinase [Spirochaetales bacterium]
MRGLIITGGEHPPIKFLVRLAKGMDITIAADSGLAVANKGGIAPDWIVGDFDSLGNQELLEEFPTERVLKYPTEKDDTDTELAFKLAKNLGCTTIEIAGAAGGRIDHFIAMYTMFLRSDHPDAWHTRRESAFYLGAHSLARMKLPLHSIVSVFPLGDESNGMSSSGLQWPLQGLRWQKGDFGISNRGVGTEALVHAGSCALLVVVPLGCEFRLQQ